MSNIKNNIARSVNDLINSGFADVQPKDLFTPTMSVHNFWKYFKYKFSSKVIEDIERVKSNNGLIHQYDEITKNSEKGNFILTITRLGLNPELHDNSLSPTLGLLSRKARALDKWGDDVEWTRKIYVIKFIGVTLEKDTPIHEGINHMSTILTDLSYRDYIKGHLMPLGGIDLYDGKKILVSYLLFDDDGIKYLEDNKIDFPEGGIPPKLP